MKARNIWNNIAVMAITLATVWLILGSKTVQAAADPFPSYPCIQKNVDFWKKVYAQFSSSQSIIHDALNPEIIYDVIDLEPWEKRGARRVNKRRVKNTKQKYKQILHRLAQVKPPFSQEEKRVLALFGPQADSAVLRTASFHIRSQLGQKDRFQLGLIRSRAYIEEIKRIFCNYELPTDLAYLPHVESSFNTEAHSRCGAVGIWQFTFHTGKRFLIINNLLDERRDPIRSSHAAARFLKENFGKLGNWPLAITAYNHGVAGMIRAQKSKGSYETIFTEYKGRRFKFASRNFYSEFLAALEVARNYQNYFGDLQFDSPLMTHEVLLAGYASVKDLAHYFDVDMQTIRKLNSGLREPVFSGQKYIPKGYLLRLPKEKLEMPRQAVSMSAALFKPSQKTDCFYKVRRGDTAGIIATMHGISLSQLISANQLDSPDLIYIGQKLWIPSRDG